MASKLMIRMGHIEFEYEGDAQFDAEAIKDLFSHLESLVGVTPAAAFDSGMPQSTASQAAGEGGNSETSLNFSPNTISAKLGVSTGPDLVLAAAAYLQFVTGLESFKRQELLDAMKSAKSYYKANMSGNLTKMLATLVSAGRINELSNSDFSLSASEQSSMKGRLAAE
ncbi:MAG: hypothetical protein Q7J28_10310 [Caulobacter sp.]|nr:hypothetical protein [Caulobacter sp.]